MKKTTSSPSRQRHKDDAYKAISSPFTRWKLLEILRLLPHPLITHFLHEMELRFTAVWKLIPDPK